jgi:Transposase
MIDRHWDGIAAYCKPETKVSLGFVEGLNNKIRVIQRRAYACAMKSTFNSKSSPACYQCSDASPSFWVRPHDFTTSLKNRDYYDLWRLVSRTRLLLRI